MLRATIPSDFTRGLTCSRFELALTNSPEHYPAPRLTPYASQRRGQVSSYSRRRGWADVMHLAGLLPSQGKTSPKPWCGRPPCDLIAQSQNSRSRLGHVSRVHAAEYAAFRAGPNRGGNGSDVAPPAAAASPRQNSACADLQLQALLTTAQAKDSQACGTCHRASIRREGHIHSPRS